MSEFLTIQVGQCGNQIGNVLWPQILQEYQTTLSDRQNGKKPTQNLNLQCMSSFFNLPERKTLVEFDDIFKYKAKAKAICVDMEDSVVSRFKRGQLRGLFDPKCFVTNYPGSGNNWAEGFWNHGVEFEDKILDTVQYFLERSDHLHGFLFLMSTGGGTGSGLGSYILKSLAENYPSIERFVVGVYPLGTEDVITCPYNMAFSTREYLNNASCVFPIENRALIDIVARELRRVPLELCSFQSFEDINGILVKLLLHLTSGSRFPGNLNLDMNDLSTNMIPFPNLNFLSTGFSPIYPKNINCISKQIKDETFVSASNRNHQMLKLDPMDSKRMLFGATLLARGAYTVSDMRGYVDKLKFKAKFPPWSQKAIKIGLCDVPLPEQKIGMLSIFNSSAMSNLFETLVGQFRKLFKKRAHIHHYTNVEGFEMEHFVECLDDLENMINIYKNYEKTQPIYTPRLIPSNK